MLGGAVVAARTLGRDHASSNQFAQSRQVRLPPPLACDPPCWPSVCRRYYIGSNKLAALGWKEEVSWEDGLQRTVDWYLSTKCDQYWQGDLESALRPHPVLLGTSLTSDPTRLLL
jgi:hypothetical protein